jgi:hypothetical protein
MNLKELFRSADNVLEGSGARPKSSGEVLKEKSAD